jgi:hypothetical protein
MSTTIDDRLGKLILLLSSPHDGEVTAAARAISRVLQGNGRSWYDLARRLGAALEEPAPSGPPPAANWRTTARWCASQVNHLSKRERDFLDSLLGWHGVPSAKQLAWLASIRRNVERRYPK